jgi:hypothetical protein
VRCCYAVAKAVLKNSPMAATEEKRSKKAVKGKDE